MWIYIGNNRFKVEIIWYLFIYLFIIQFDIQQQKMSLFHFQSHWFKNRRSRSKPDKSDQSAESVEELVNEVKQIADSILYA